MILHTFRPDTRNHGPSSHKKAHTGHDHGHFGGPCRDQSQYAMHLQGSHGNSPGYCEVLARCKVCNTSCMIRMACKTRGRSLEQVRSSERRSGGSGELVLGFTVQDRRCYQVYIGFGFLVLCSPSMMVSRGLHSG